MKKIMYSLIGLFILSIGIYSCSKEFKQNEAKYQSKSTINLDFEKAGIRHNQALKEFELQFNNKPVSKKEAINFFLKFNYNLTDNTMANFLENYYPYGTKNNYAIPKYSNDILNSYINNTINILQSNYSFVNITNIQNSVSKDGRLTQDEKLMLVNFMSIAKHSYYFWSEKIKNSNLNQVKNEDFGDIKDMFFIPGWVFADIFAYLDCYNHCSNGYIGNCSEDICINAAAYASGYKCPFYNIIDKTPL